MHQSEKYGKIYVAEINAKPWATMDTSMPLMVGDVLLEVDGTDVRITGSGNKPIKVSGWGQGQDWGEDEGMLSVR